MARPSRLALCVALGAVGGVTAQTFQSQVNISMCSWDRFRANVIRDTIYLDGGELYWRRGLSDGTFETPEPDAESQRAMYTLQLGKSFDTSTTNLTGLFEPLSKTGGPVNNVAPTTVDGAMLANDYKLYLYGGMIPITDSYDNPPDASDILEYESYQYGPAKTDWEPGFLIGSMDDVTRYVTNGAGASAPSEQLGFYFSGMRAEDWGPVHDVPPTANTSSHKLISVDMSKMRDEVWSNSTIHEDVPARASGELVWVPVADSGVLIAIGGVKYPEDLFDGLSDDQEDENNETGPGFMSTLPVYDIAGDAWYMQNTTGDTPPQLAHFCSVVAPAPDKSSFNIYIYGGYDGTNRTARPSDDVYVLSVPSFTWVKVYEGESNHGRSGHKCIRTYPDKMFVLGGRYLGANNCVRDGIIQVFNLNTLRFQNEYDPEDWEDYQVPDLITAQIGGDGSGGADKEPKEWSSDELSDVFGKEYTKTISTYYPYTATGSSTSTSTSSDGSSSGGSGGGGGFPKWAGAVIGVVLGLVVISIAIIFWLLWRRRRTPGKGPLFAQSEAGTSDNRKRILGWMYGIVQPTHKPEMTNAASTELGINDKPIPGQASDAGLDSVASPRATSTAMFSDTTAQEAASEAVHEVHGEHVGPQELPTDYNLGAGDSSAASMRARARHISDTPSEMHSPTVSPAVSPTPEDQAARDREQTQTPSQSEDAGQHPTHYRNHSSISSAGMGFPVSLDEAITRGEPESEQHNSQPRSGQRQVSAFVEDLSSLREEEGRNSRDEPRSQR